MLIHWPFSILASELIWRSFGAWHGMREPGRWADMDFCHICRFLWLSKWAWWASLGSHCQWGRHVDGWVAVGVSGSDVSWGPFIIRYAVTQTCLLLGLADGHRKSWTPQGKWVKDLGQNILRSRVLSAWVILLNSRFSRAFLFPMEIWIQ